jgi:hypothetical protein
MTRLSNIAKHARIRITPTHLPMMLSLLILFGAGLAQAAGPTGKNDPQASAQLAEALRQSALPISLEHGRPVGPGADWIARESANAQFVLIGEDHGMAEAPRIAAALWNAQMGGAFQQLVIETGPYATVEMADALRAGSEGLAALNARYPTAIPFFTWREDGEMAEAAVASDGTAALCGVDQEFILSGRMLFRTLWTLAPTPAAAKMAADFAERDDAMYADMMANRDPSASLLTRLEPQDFASLRQAFAGHADALALITDLETSAEIYALQSSDPTRSNAMRSTLMKRNFMRCYRDAAQTSSPPRALFRMGAFHVGRGRNPLGLFDLGNLASELAQSNGRTSLHLLVIAAGGVANRWFPFAPEEAAKCTAYNAKDELGVVGALPLLDAADRKHWTLLPLAPLRTRPELRRAGGEAFDQLVFGYDAVIVVPEAQAAVLYGDPAS